MARAEGLCVEVMAVLKSNDEKEPCGSLKQFTRQGTWTEAWQFRSQDWMVEYYRLKERSPRKGAEGPVMVGILGRVGELLGGVSMF